VAQRQPAYEPHEHVTTPARPVAAAPVATTRTRPSYGGLAARIVLTLLGAAGLIVGSFMNVADGTQGTAVPVRALWTTDLSGSAFISSLGFAMIVVGLVAIVGMALRTGWLTSFAGAVGVAATILFVVEVNRADGSLNGVDAGTWLWGIGALLCLIGGFFGARREVVETTNETPYVAP
jgi:hypothetical protein